MRTWQARSPLHGVERMRAGLDITKYTVHSRFQMVVSDISSTCRREVARDRGEWRSSGERPHVFSELGFLRE